MLTASRPPRPQLNRPQMRAPHWWERYAPAPSADQAVRTLKRLIWLYWLLWLGEGALRKWIFPFAAAPLVIIRDPVAMLILVVALHRGSWRVNSYTGLLWGMALVGFVLTIMNRVDYRVALVGLRTIGLHWPLIFVMGSVLDRRDIERMGNLAIDLSLPMALLMVLQFRAGPDSFINTGAGADAAQIGGVMDGKIRAPGVFSFISGAAQYYGMVAAFCFARFWDERNKFGSRLVLGALGMAIAINMAISRTLLGSVIVVFIIFLGSVIRIGISARRFALFLGVGIAAIALVAGSALLREGNEALLARWLSANDAEGSIIIRFLSSFTVSGEVLSDAGVMGHGIGVGTNMGASLLGQAGEFLLAEGEWERVVLEMGVILGGGFILWRIVLFGQIAVQATKAWVHRDVLPVLLVAAGGLTLLIGQSGQPATLGFGVLAMGAAIAAGNVPTPLPRRRPIPPRKIG